MSTKLRIREQRGLAMSNQNGRTYFWERENRGHLNSFPPDAKLDTESYQRPQLEVNSKRQGKGSQVGQARIVVWTADKAGAM